MADVSLTLLVLKTCQVEQLQRFYRTLDVELAEEQHGKGPVGRSILLAGPVT